MHTRGWAEGYLGKDLERDLIQEVQLAAKDTGGEGMPFLQAVDLVRANQPPGWNPEDPPTSPTAFPSDLYLLVDERLKEKLSEEVNRNPSLARALSGYAGGGRLAFCTAAGSQLDTRHKVDAFFELDFFDRVGAQVPPARRVFSTIDVTQNPAKAEHDVKADVLAYLGGYMDASREERERMVQVIADEIAENLIEKLKGQGVRRQLVS